jgi:hypothetical protein
MLANDFAVPREVGGEAAEYARGSEPNSWGAGSMRMLEERSHQPAHKFSWSDARAAPEFALKCSLESILVRQHL